MIRIQNGRVHVGNGVVLEETDILIEDGKITKVGKNLQGESDCCIDAKGKEVFPGFIDPVSSYGCMDTTFRIRDTDEVSSPITPEVHIKYAFNHGEIMDEALYEVGITAIGAAPGNKNILGGQMAVYSTIGENSLKMKLADTVGVKGAASLVVKDTYGSKDRFPMTRMGIFSKLEQLFEKTMLSKDKEEKDNQQKVLEKILEGTLPLFVQVVTEAEIQALLHVCGKYPIRLFLVGAFDAHKCVESLKGQRVGVIVGEQNYLNIKNYRKTDLKQIASLLEADIPVSFSVSTEYGAEGKLTYLWNAISFYREKVEAEKVLRMMTIEPAKMLGVDSFLGSIEEGKRADLVIYDQNPITSYDARAMMTFVGGQLVYQRGGRQ